MEFFLKNGESSNECIIESESSSSSASIVECPLSTNHFSVHYRMCIVDSYYRANFARIMLAGRWRWGFGWSVLGYYYRSTSSTS